MLRRMSWRPIFAVQASLLALGIGLVAPAAAQTGPNLQDRAVGPPATGAGAPAPTSEDDIAFSSAALITTMTPTSSPRRATCGCSRSGSRLRADKVVWNRMHGRGPRLGQRRRHQSGRRHRLWRSTCVLSDDMKNGVVDNMLIVLANGGRLASKHGVRKDAITTLRIAALTRPARSRHPAAAPRSLRGRSPPSASSIDENRHRIYYKDARISLLGFNVLWLPGFSHPDGSDRSRTADSGLLLPNFQVSKVLGLDLSLPYYIQLAPNRDLTITPHLYSKVAPGLEVEYRAIEQAWAPIRCAAMITYGSRLPASVDTTGVTLDKDKGVRGFIDANGTYQLGPDWTLLGQLRLETDRTFMRRYDINSDDRLRSTLQARAHR
jgi:LPS-assembly protein